MSTLNGYCQVGSLPCQHIGYERLSELVGTWKVEAMDRTSPGNYEMNAGI